MTHIESKAVDYGLYRGCSFVLNRRACGPRGMGKVKKSDSCVTLTFAKAAQYDVFPKTFEVISKRLVLTWSKPQASALLDAVTSE